MAEGSMNWTRPLWYVVISPGSMVSTGTDKHSSLGCVTHVSTGEHPVIGFFTINMKKEPLGVGERQEQCSRVSMIIKEKSPVLPAGSTAIMK